MDKFKSALLGGTLASVLSHAVEGVGNVRPDLIGPLNSNVGTGYLPKAAVLVGRGASAAAGELARRKARSVKLHSLGLGAEAWGLFDLLKSVGVQMAYAAAHNFPLVGAALGRVGQDYSSWTWPPETLGIQRVGLSYRTDSPTASKVDERLPFQRDMTY